MRKKILLLLLLEVISLLSLINQSPPLEPFVIIIATILGILNVHFKLINNFRLVYFLVFLSVPIRLYSIIFDKHMIDLVYANFVCLAFLVVYIIKDKKRVM
ncbi:hypothetical protein AB1I62_08695 [Enterococcus sp. AN402]|uniref:hypothetical protein n=1 Tax=Enterococcus sp. AN402 TaxID=3151386 RepID=UPI00345B4743